MNFFRRYKEIWFGFALGAAMWLVDAGMHVELGAEVHAKSLFSEIFAPHPTALIFRGFYLAIAAAFGIFCGERIGASVNYALLSRRSSLFNASLTRRIENFRSGARLAKS
jgi:hypothetical protein